jgi:hypothetical protein
MVEKNKKPITVGKITLWFGLLLDIYPKSWTELIVKN